MTSLSLEQKLVISHLLLSHPKNIYLTNRVSAAIRVSELGAKSAKEEIEEIKEQIDNLTAGRE